VGDRILKLMGREQTRRESRREGCVELITIPPPPSPRRFCCWVTECAVSRCGRWTPRRLAGPCIALIGEDDDVASSVMAQAVDPIVVTDDVWTLERSSVQRAQLTPGRVEARRIAEARRELDRAEARRLAEVAARERANRSVAMIDELERNQRDILEFVVRSPPCAVLV
jgi:hypothetical protein